MTGQQAEVDGRSGRLPATPRTSLVGRDAQVDAALAALGSSRLVTLTGPGGVGKTRLALAVLARAGELARDGVWWVQLAALHEGDLVAQTVAAAVGTERAGGSTPAAALAERLRTARALLVLDNCEHLVAGCADLVDELLDGCPELRVLATSREPLGVAGESVRPVPPLPLAADDGGSAPAVQLFAERARAAVPDFAVTGANADVVARLCRRLGGLPLAIELAAARMRVLSVEQILDGLDDVFSLLVGGPRTAPERHRTLRATLDWGHELLTGSEQTVFRRLAVFPGAFDLPAAQAVASSGTEARGGIAAADVLDLVSALVDRSLVTVQRAGGAVRYRLLAPIRDYGRERLAAAGEQDSARAAHLAHYLDLAEKVEPLLTGSDQVRLLDLLESEANNLRGALRFARDAGRTTEGARLAVALWRLCTLRGHYREGREWLDWSAVVLGDDVSALRARALRGGGGLAFLECDYPAAVRRLGAALQLYRELDDPCGAASVLQLLGSVAREQGRYARAEALHEESRTLFTTAGDRPGAAHARNFLGFLAWLQQDWAAAGEHCTRALADFRELGDAEGIAWSLISLGTTAQYTGDTARAGALLAEAVELSTAARYPEGIAWAVHEQGLLALRAGDDARARTLLRDSLDRHRLLGDRWRTASVLADLAAAELAGGRPRRAAVLLGAAARARDEIGTVVAPCERADHDRTDAQARGTLGADGFATAWARGRDDTLEHALADDDADDDAGDDAEDDATPHPVPPPRKPVTGSPQLRISVLGQATVRLGERRIETTDWGYGKPRELFFLLACSGGQTRAQLGLALWPDLSEAQLRNAFHTALRDLRRALGDPGWVVFTGGRYRLDRSREHWSDLEEYEAALAAARRATAPSDVLAHLQRAIGTYGGELLPEVRSEWVQERRGELTRTFAAALSAAGGLLGGAGRWPEATEVLRRAVALEPLREASSRALMRSLVGAGEPAQAARVYQELADRLRRELEIAPAEQTRALYGRLTRS